MKKSKYKKCDRCSYDIQDEDGDIIEHYCIDNQEYLPPTKQSKMKPDLKKYLKQDSHYFSEGHLEGWYKAEYAGQLKKEVKYKLQNSHDTSLEIENAESELGRELKEKEKLRVVKKLNKSILSALVFKRKVAVGFFNSLGEFNL
jgi:hypothetical protein